MQGRGPLSFRSRLTPGCSFVVRTVVPAGDRAFSHRVKVRALAGLRGGGNLISSGMADWRKLGRFRQPRL